MFAVTPSGTPAAFETAIVAPRQNLKTGTLKQGALGWMFLLDRRLIVWSAHEFSTAQEAFRDMLERWRARRSWTARSRQCTGPTATRRSSCSTAAA